MLKPKEYYAVNWYGTLPIADFIGEVFKSVQRNEDEIVFVTTSNRKFCMNHELQCCENVEIESIVGDLEDLVDSPILLCEEAMSDNHAEDTDFTYKEHSCTWTFYKFATIKGYVDIRWIGKSNGYYSESVTIEEITQ